MRIGQGWDVHRMAPSRALMIGGIQIPSEKGEVGHSDGDVLLHAIIDALLGVDANGDIGSHFPPSDDRWKDVDSKELVRLTMKDFKHKIINLDSTIILQRPKLREHIDSIRESLASLLGMDIKDISVKAKTAEHLYGELGSGDAIEASVVILVE